MKPKVLNLSGSRVGMLSVLAEATSFINIDKYGNWRNKRRWLCQCDCGRKVVIVQTNLREGSKGVRGSRSCGCRIAVARRRAGHGLRRTSEYRIWSGMIDRCENPNNLQYSNYGGRGICICAKWRESFLAFRADMGSRPPGRSIDRIDVNGNYEPGNCRWADKWEQASNKRTTSKIAYDGKIQSMAQWARDLDLDRRTVSSRLAKGWPLDKALSPLRYKFNGNLWAS